MASETAESFEVTDPATGTTVAFVAALDAQQTTEAIGAAARAFPAWRALLLQERARILRKLVRTDQRHSGLHRMRLQLRFGSITPALLSIGPRREVHAGDGASHGTAS
nr:aldehyde dehydrogenase family protein [Mesorhizobium amorphae]